MDRHEGGEDADQEQDQHHVLSKPDVLRLYPGRSSASKEIFLGVELSAAKSPAGPRLLQRLNVVLVDDPGVDAELKLRLLMIMKSAVINISRDIYIYLRSTLSTSRWY